MTQHFKKPPIIPTLFTAASLIVLSGLGTWQAQKYFAKVEGRSGICETGVMEAPQETAFHTLAASPLAPCPDKILISGALDQSKIIPIGPRVHDGEVGYHLYAPLSGQDESHILVNLGWSLEKEIGDIMNLRQISTITGSLMTPSPKGMFTLENNPADNEWYTLDIKEIGAHYAIENLASEVVFARSVEPVPEKPLIPAELSKLYLTPETHLQYAAFWYFMGLALLVIFILRFVKAPK